MRVCKTILTLTHNKYRKQKKSERDTEMMKTYHIIKRTASNGEGTRDDRDEQLKESIR